MKLAVIAVAAAILASGCATPSANSTRVADRADRDRITSQRNTDAYSRADSGSSGNSGDMSRNPADSGSRN